MPRFSIILPCHNAARTLGDTLHSLRAQTCGDWEALVIDDGSTDGTFQLITRAARDDARIRPMTHLGKGPSAARNAAALAARGDILAFCDADDLWRREKLTCLTRVFDDAEVDASYARIAFFDGVRTRSLSGPVDGDLTLPMLMGENPVCTLSNLAVRREVFAATGGFDDTLVQNEDLDWLIRAVGEGHRIAGVNRVLVDYRTSVSGLSSDLDALREGRRAALRSAARYGFDPRPAEEAIYLRYLARRALRIGAPPAEALRLALSGCAQSPRGWFSDVRRGAMTLAGALAAPVLPRRLRQSLFAC
ncbi:MAG: glucosyl transferase [Rhodobacteraceae bacterium]|nr:glucosyl transferase [Paracoccaceae bacterium]